MESTVGLTLVGGWFIDPELNLWPCCRRGSVHDNVSESGVWSHRMISDGGAGGTLITCSKDIHHIPPLQLPVSGAKQMTTVGPSSYLALWLQFSSELRH